MGCGSGIGWSGVKAGTLPQRSCTSLRACARKASAASSERTSRSPSLFTLMTWRVWMDVVERSFAALHCTSRVLATSCCTAWALAWSLSSVETRLFELEVRAVEVKVDGGGLFVFMFSHTRPP